MPTRLRSLAAFLFLALGVPGSGESAPAERLWLTHYMPWYSAPGPDSGDRWGWHWTMDHFDPNQIRWDGRREIASHEYPLIGPYDSGDDAALECQVLLMKFAGLDGVVIDWYGTGDHFDHAVNHRHTERLVTWLKRAGLKFAVCYEDQAFGRLKLAPGEDLEQARRDLLWASEHWFADDAYVAIEGRPLVLCFGPQHFKAEAWGALRESLPKNPLLFGLPHLSQSHGFDGFYGWPPVSGGKTLAPGDWSAELATLTQRHRAGERFVAVAFPGFRDIYAEAGVHESYGSIAHRQGKTFAESLHLAEASGAPVIQIATWNDYGEGTVIEPTWTHGFRFLGQLQERTGAAHGPADLRLPVVLHRLRQRVRGEAAATAELDRASALLFEGKAVEAEAILAAVSRDLGTRPAVFPDKPTESDPHYRLGQEILYRDESGSDGLVHQRCRLDLYRPAAGPACPTLVWFHGGGLTGGERSVPLPLRGKGIAIATAGYRLAPGSSPESAIEDAAAAVAWVLEHAADHGLDPDRVFVGGHSAGAYLSLMLGLDDRWLGAHGLKRERIAGLVALSPQVITHFAIRETRGIDEKQPVVDAFAPLFHVRKDAPPLLLVTGDRERELMGRYEENAYFWRMMKLAGHPATSLRELDGFGHGDMPEPAFPLVLEFMEKTAPAKR